MTTAIAALAIVSSYLFAGFPFDNLCAENVSHSAYVGTWKITDGQGLGDIAAIEPMVRSYHYCNQYLGPGTNFIFPALPEAQSPHSSWMTEEQKQLTRIYGWVSVGVLGLICLNFLYYGVIKSIKNIFSASYKPDGQVQGQSFSEVDPISSFVPQVVSDHFTHPLLAVNIDHVDESIFDWKDPVRSHSYYDMTRDAEQLMKGNEDMCQSAFSQIRHWPPGGSSKEDNGPKSALRKSKDINKRGHGISWSSKVTCKTYSKEDPNTQNPFNGNASTSEGMNFSGHSDPLYDPHAQNEGRGLESHGNATGLDPFDSTTDDLQNNDHGQQAQQNQPPPNQHFDQYHNTGLDYPNQPPDPFFGDSQNQEDGTSWEEGTESVSGSYSQTSQSGSGSSTTSGPYSNSNNSVSSGTSSFSEASSSCQNYNPFNQRDYLNNNDVNVVDEDGSSSSRSHRDQNGNVDFGSVASSRDGSNDSAGSHFSRDLFHEEEVFEGGSSRDGSNASGSNYSEVPDDEEEFYDDEAEAYKEEDQSWEGTGTNSTGSSASRGLPPIT